MILKNPTELEIIPHPWTTKSKYFCQTNPPAMNHCFFLWVPASCWRLHSKASCVGLASNQKATTALRRIPKGRWHWHLQTGLFKAPTTLFFDLPVFAYDDESSGDSVLCNDCSLSRVRSTCAGPEAKGEWSESSSSLSPEWPELESVVAADSFLGRAAGPVGTIWQQTQSHDDCLLFQGL